MAASVLEWFNLRLNFKHRITNSRQAVALVGLCKKLCLGDARPVGQTEKLHRLDCDLMVGALLNDEAAGCDRLSNELAGAIYRAIRVPPNIVKKFKRMNQ